MSNLKKSYLILFAFIIAGIVLRLLWPSDMEWKYDEIWMYFKSQEMAKTGHWPSLGMTNSTGSYNPAMSIWSFILLAFVSNSPVQMMIYVALLNIIAIIAILIYALKCITNDDEKLVWVSGIALAAVSPLPILFSRKIWAQDLLPFFSIFLFLGHQWRHKKAGAFIWGLAGALIGQVHISGFFYAFAFFALSIIKEFKERKNPDRKVPSSNWIFWLLGSLLGTLPMIPWINFILHHHATQHYDWKQILSFSFYTNWFLDATGLNISYTTKGVFWDFIKEPILGIPSYFVSVAHLFLIVTGIYALLQIPKKISSFNFSSSLDFALIAILLIMGPIFTLTSIKIQAHYLIVCFPFVHLSLAKLLASKRKLWISILCAQLLISASFLAYVHKKGVIPKSEYARTYRSQQPKTFVPSSNGAK